MNTEPIIFKQGEENGIVIERDNFEHSIFLNQYLQAAKIFCRIWEQQKNYLANDNKVAKHWTKYGVDNLFANVIAFCGDRGEGKSSSMISFASILTEKEVREKAMISLDLDEQSKQSLSQIEPEKIDLLGVIDPSFFDHEHNLLELLLGRMYSNISKEIEKQEKDSCIEACTHDHRKLMELFQKVKSCMKILEKRDKIYDELENLNDLSAGINLQGNLYKLFECYTKFMQKERLVVCIDDIDLNVKEGYKMAEILRKYLLTCPHLIVLVAVKVDQLEDVIANTHKVIYQKSEITWNDCKQIARKYVDKLLPRSNRIIMPELMDICERRIQLAEKTDDKQLEDMTVKERVVQLIFQKTGYVFYNSQSISPIIPKNLRSLRHLLGTLESLPDARTKDGEDDETGREVFKDYFFGTWVSANLNKDDHGFAAQLEQYNNLSTFNAFVVEFFAKRIKNANIDIKELPKSNPPINNKEGEDADIYSGDFAPLYLQIVNSTNTSTNISLGDVMYILWLVSTITVDTHIQNLIFFIKTVYSMRLYACYNAVTQNEDLTLFPEANQNTSRISIHKADSLYERVNQLQRLVNGSYFSYPEGALLSNKRDTMVLEFDKVRELFKPLKTIYKEIEKLDKLKEETKSKNEANTEDDGQKVKRKEWNEEEKQLVRFCEFLALSITYASTLENITKANFTRTSKTPTFYGAFSHTANYAIFDFLNPFYALTNIKYAYHRFDEILSDKPTEYKENDQVQQNKLYKIAESCPDSLLSKFKQIREGDYDDDWNMHGLVSDAIIRVIDIQWSIFEELLRQYRKHRTSKLSDKIRLAYNDIQEIKITLYPKLSIKNNIAITDSNAHPVKFEFLDKIKDLLSKDVIENELRKIIADVEAEKGKGEEEKFTTALMALINKIEKWPILGKDIVPKISDISGLKSGKKGNLTKNLNSIFKSEESYTYDQVLSNKENVLSKYRSITQKKTK